MRTKKRRNLVFSVKTRFCPHIYNKLLWLSLHDIFKICLVNTREWYFDFNIHGVISLPEMKTRVVCQNISRYVISIDASRLVNMNEENDISEQD